MKKSVMIALTFSVSICNFAQIIGYPDALYTKAERTQYLETSLHYDVINFVEMLSAGSDLVHMEIMGTSKGGRSIPLVVMSNPGVSTPEEAAASGKSIIYIQANIHGGEVEGKEASMIMMREIAFGQKKYLLDNQILIFCPLYNADGNDALSPDNRSSQDGSPVEAGERYSGEGLDLNRDGLKLESIEGTALTENVILRWNPVMFVDLHTTNGTWHGYPLTYAPGMSTAGHKGTSKYLMETLFPEVTEKVRERSGIDTYLYGNFSEFPPQVYNGMLTLPRYLTNSLALRNMLTILVETFAHDRFERRILSNITWLTTLFEYTGENSADILRLKNDIEGEVVNEIKNYAGQLRKGVQYQRAQEGPASDLLVYDPGINIDQFGIERERRTGRRFWVSGVRKMTSVGILREATVPKAYVFPAELYTVAQKLMQHGISVQQLDGSIQYSGEEYTVTALNQSGYNYQGHYLTTISGYFTNQTRIFPEGSFYVDLAHPLAYLIFYLLEPEADDGLTVWNYFDEYLIARGVNTQDVAFPVFKVIEAGSSVDNLSLEESTSIIYDENSTNIKIRIQKGILIPGHIQICDPSGRIISTINLIPGLTDYYIPTDKYSKGIYFLRIISGNQQTSKKLVLN